VGASFREVCKEVAAEQVVYEYKSMLRSLMTFFLVVVVWGGGGFFSFQF
jgi:hypothetical protein